jgi:hypothetical protein
VGSGNAQPRVCRATHRFTQHFAIGIAKSTPAIGATAIYSQNVAGRCHGFLTFSIHRH